MICFQCLHFKECFERRGQCKEFKSLEDIKAEIEKLNEDNKKTSGRPETSDKSRIQEAGRGRRKVYQDRGKQTETNALSPWEMASDEEKTKSQFGGSNTKEDFKGVEKEDREHKKSS